MNLPFKGGYKITQNFGENKAYYSQWGLSGHEGIDLIPVDSDWNLHAIEGGVVVQDNDVTRNNYGIYCVIWNKENKRSWWYCHMANNTVKIGQTVKQGDIIGKMGNTGNSTGAHLHLGSRNSDANGNAINLNNGFSGFVDPLPTLELLVKATEKPVETPPQAPTVTCDEFKKQIDDLLLANSLLMKKSNENEANYKDSLNAKQNEINTLHEDLVKKIDENFALAEQIKKLTEQAQTTKYSVRELTSLLMEAVKEKRW